MSEQIAQKLDEARALIEKGWCQHTFYTIDRNGLAHFCAIGAIRDAAGVPYVACPEVKQPAEVVARAIGLKSSLGELGHWNDAPERTQAEVIEAFRKAAELARAS